MSVTTPHPRQKPGMISNRLIAPQATADSTSPEGVDWANRELYSILKILAIPAIYILSIIVLKIHPGKVGLYGFAAFFGLILLIQMRKGPEILLALVIIYYPLSKMYAVRLAPGINGTNLLEIFLIFFWISHSIKHKKPMFKARPFTKVTGIWFFITMISVLTAMSSIGFHQFIWNYTLSFRAFIDQFIVFFIVINLIQDKNMARRLIIYMMFSMTVIFLFGIHEWWDSRNVSSIAKSRLLGPVGQPNDFAAQIIYAFAPLLAYGAYYFPKWKSIRMAPIFFIGLRVLLAAFSRGAYLAFAMELFTLSFIKSKKFFILILVVIGSIYFFIPSLVPNSMKARVAQTYQDHEAGSTIDKSADSRFLLWQAAIEMTKEDPLFGKGFNQFQRLAPGYIPGFYGPGTGSTGGATDNQNMFLYEASTMGVPGLAIFITLISLLFLRSWILYKTSVLDIDRIAGLGGVTMVAGLVGVNMFGTHVADTSVDIFFWIYIAIISHLMTKPATASHWKNNEKQR